MSTLSKAGLSDVKPYRKIVLHSYCNYLQRSQPLGGEFIY